MYYKYEWKKTGKNNNQKLLYVIFEILMIINKDLYDSYKDGLYFN